MPDGTVFATLDALADDFIYAPAKKRLRARFSSASRLAKKLNAQNFSGHADWRVPTAEEKILLEKARRRFIAENSAIHYGTVTGGQASSGEASVKAAFNTRVIRSETRPYDFSREKLDADEAAREKIRGPLGAALAACGEAGVPLTRHSGFRPPRHL
jgi:hypothetical protein